MYLLFIFILEWTRMCCREGFLCVCAYVCACVSPEDLGAKCGRGS